MSDSDRIDVLVVGAGLAGLYQLHLLRGLGFRTRVVEAGDGVGGTWYWNRYPGARCDVESHFYSYSFDPELEQEWVWTEKYPTQPEILRYVNHVADRYDLRRDITFDTRVTAATYDDDAQRWTVETDTGETIDAQFLIMATGCLSFPKAPEIPGAELFRGPIHHTNRWPHEGVDFTGMRVGVIGTGSSGVQSIPVIAQQASELTVFQRTPNFSFPAHHRPLEERRGRGAEGELPRVARAAAHLACRGAQRAADEEGSGGRRRGARGALSGGVGRGNHRGDDHVLHGHARRQGLQRHARRLHPRQDPHDRRRPRGRGDPLPDLAPGGHEAPPPGRGLLRDVQPGARPPRRPAQDAARRDHRARHPDDGGRVRARRDRARDRVRRHDRRPAARSTSPAPAGARSARPGRRARARTSASGSPASRTSSRSRARRARPS